MEFNEGETHWARINERVSPTGTSYTAKQLKPHTSYRFRIQGKLLSKGKKILLYEKLYRIITIIYLFNSSYE